MESFEHPAPTTSRELIAWSPSNRDEASTASWSSSRYPSHIDEKAVIRAVDPAKDVDGFHVANAGRLAVGERALVPCTPLGCLMLLKDRLGDLSGLEAVVLGRSNIVGKPMAQLLLQENCTVTIAHSRTRDLPHVIRRADIVVAAVGQPQMVRGDWLKPGATVIDVGINRIKRRRGPDEARRRCGFRQRHRRRRSDHAGPGRSRPDDDRRAAPEHARCSACARRHAYASQPMISPLPLLEAAPAEIWDGSRYRVNLQDRVGTPRR
jgi:hypothetical protein